MQSDWFMTSTFEHTVLPNPVCCNSCYAVLQYSVLRCYLDVSMALIAMASPAIRVCCSTTARLQHCNSSSVGHRAHSEPVYFVICGIVLQPKRPFMLRTLPSRHFAELEELLPEALSNSTMVNGLECKLSHRSSKVCSLMPAVMCELPGNSTILDV